jgi:hypothetical protein
MTLLSTKGATSSAWAADANDFASTVRQVITSIAKKGRLPSP